MVRLAVSDVPWGHEAHGGRPFGLPGLERSGGLFRFCDRLPAFFLAFTFSRVPVLRWAPKAEEVQVAPHP